MFAADKPNGDINPRVLTPGARVLLEEAKQTYAGDNHGAQMTIPALAGFVGGWALVHDVLPQAGSTINPESIRSAAYRVNVCHPAVPLMVAESGSQLRVRMMLARMCWLHQWSGSGSQPTEWQLCIPLATRPPLHFCR